MSGQDRLDDRRGGTSCVIPYAYGMRRSVFADGGGEWMADQPLPYHRPPDLPLFDEPPVHEVSMAIQFQPIPLRSVDLGVLRDRLAGHYSGVDEVAPVALQVENFTLGSRSDFEIKFAVLDRPPIPMLIFTSDDQTSQVQVQADRFACVWRQQGEAGDYPRYAGLRDDFIRNAQIFSGFVEAVADGVDVRVTQAELIYVNTIDMQQGDRPDVLAGAVPLAYPSGSLRTSGLIVNHALAFQNSDGIDYARLHVRAEPVTGRTALRLSLAYRGEPYERDEGKPGLATLMGFFDEGHDLIVRGFAANTTTEAQRPWRRTQ
jgi:uncharacterized protein (TIGR04255 family)